MKFNEYQSYDHKNPFPDQLIRHKIEVTLHNVALSKEEVIHRQMIDIVKLQQENQPDDRPPINTYSSSPAHPGTPLTTPHHQPLPNRSPTCSPQHSIQQNEVTNEEKTEIHTSPHQSAAPPPPSPLQLQPEDSQPQRHAPCQLVAAPQQLGQTAIAHRYEETPSNKPDHDANMTIDKPNVTVNHQSQKPPIPMDITNDPPYNDNHSIPNFDVTMNYQPTTYIPPTNASKPPSKSQQFNHYGGQTPRHRTQHEYPATGYHEDQRQNTEPDQSMSPPTFDINNSTNPPLDQYQLMKWKTYTPSPTGHPCPIVIAKRLRCRQAT